MQNDLISQSVQAIRDLHSVMGTLIELQRETLAGSDDNKREERKQRLENANALFQKQAGILAEMEQAAQGEAIHLRQISVERMSVVEEDGTLRMAITNKKRAPNPVIDGKEMGSRDHGSAAGMIFYDNEGTECGGLIFGGSRNPDGTYQAGGSLTMDQFRQDQVIMLQHEEVNGQKYAGLQIWDRAELSIDKWIEKIVPVFAMPDGLEKENEIEKLRAAGLLPAQRIFVGKYDRNSIISLSDGDGKARLRMTVSTTGEAQIEFLNAKGEVTRRIAAE